MNGRTSTERILDVFLAPDSDQLADRVIDAALADIARSPQRRALRVPWRFPLMPALSRTTGIVAVALVVVIGVGAFVYFGSKGSNSVGAAGGTPAPSAAPTASLTAGPTASVVAAASPKPSEVAPGIPAWATYTSAVYGSTMAYPSDWSLHSPAEHKWKAGEPALPDAWPWADIFASPDGNDQIALWVWQVPAPAGADLTSWAGLQHAFTDVCESPSFTTCTPAGPGTSSPPAHLCVGDQACGPALVLSMGAADESAPWGVVGDPVKQTITVFEMGRPDNWPGTAKYGGTTALLKSILTQVGVRSPQPGESPHQA